MIYRTRDELPGIGREVNWGNGLSRRFLLQEDGVGVSFCETTVEAGTESRMQYNSHAETCFCISGEGEIECNGRIYPLVPGTLYSLSKGEAHILRSRTAMTLASIFNPPLKGDERHLLSPSGYSSYSA